MMRSASLIGLTLEIYGAALADPRPPDALIAKFFRVRKFLGAHDRRFIAETMYAMFRHKTRIERIAAEIIAPRADGKIAAPLAALIAYAATEPGMQLPPDFIEGVAEQSRLDTDTARELFDVVKRYHGEEHFTSDVTRIAAQCSYPEWLAQKFAAQYGAESAEALCRAMNEQAPIALRVNTLKTTIEACAATLAEEGVETTPGAYSPDALILRKRINAFALKAFRNGFFEMQDEGSQIVSRFCDPHPDWKILDACAGAGGKTLHFAALMHNRGEIFALDQNTYQIAEIRRRLRRAGAQNVRVLLFDGFERAKTKYRNGMDVVLIDAPCSGTGTIRRNPLAKWRLTEEKIPLYAARQLAILDTYSPCVRINGKLVYATCSVLKEENEDVVEAFLRSHPSFRLAETRSPKLPLPANVFDGSYIRMLPHIHTTDGFFAAALARVE